MYTLSLYSFLPRDPSFLIEYDALLTGYGVGVCEWSSSTDTFELIGYSSLEAPFPVTDDSSRQNCQEYVADVGTFVG
jgi:hypothetical protein